MTPDPHGAGAYVDPATGVSSVPGLPPGLLLEGRKYAVESYQANGLSPSGEEGFITVNPGGWAVALQSPDPLDTVSMSLARATLTANPAGAPAGHQRQGVVAIPADSFSATTPRVVACRFRMAPGTTIPTAVDDYLASPAGLNDQPAGVVEANNGPYIMFDRTLGVASWVCRAARAGVRIQQTYSLAYDNAMHVIGFRHEGALVRLFLDGAWVGATLVGAQVQPAANVFMKTLQLVQLAATLGINPQMDMDWAMWGPIA